MRQDYARLAKVDKIAAEVLESMRLRRLPIDPCEIAKQEGIELAPGQYGADFYGRIEYHHQEAGFILFHPDLENCRFPQLIRFSIGHELAHYYIPEHAALLRAGEFHNSTSGFICDNVLEQEADHFAGALLIPEKEIKERCRKRGWMDMSAILKLAGEAVASVSCAAIRYAKCSEEHCIAILSRSATGEVICAVPSEEAQAQGMTWVEKIPSKSKTATLSEVRGAEILGGKTVSHLWFPNRRESSDLWEEALPLGGTGIALTLLSLQKE